MKSVKPQNIVNQQHEICETSKHGKPAANVCTIYPIGSQTDTQNSTRRQR